MTKNQIIALYKSLHQLGDLKGAKFAYAINKNIALLKADIEAIDKALVSDEKFNEFEEARISLAKKYSEKDDSGESKVQVSKQDPNLQEFVMADINAFKKELTKLQEEYKDTIEKREAFLNEETIILGFPHHMNVDDVPKDISVPQMNSIFALIKE